MDPDALLPPEVALAILGGTFVALLIALASLPRLVRSLAARRGEDRHWFAARFWLQLALFPSLAAMGLSVLWREAGGLGAFLLSLAMLPAVAGALAAIRAHDARVHPDRTPDPREAVHRLCARGVALLGPFGGCVLLFAPPSEALSVAVLLFGCAANIAVLVTLGILKLRREGAEPAVRGGREDRPAA